MGKISGRNGPDPGEGGAPRKPIDHNLVRRLAGIGCTVDEIAVACGVSIRCMFKRIEAEPELAEAIEEGRATGKATLRRLQWQGARAGNATMLIWLGKQLLGQRDKTEITGKDGGAIQHEDVTDTRTPIDDLLTGSLRKVVGDVPTTKH
jgi:hypothetical protein